MYARNYNDGSNKQSFFRGEYNVPANYSGNAFVADNPPEFPETLEKKDIGEPESSRTQSESSPLLTRCEAADDNTSPSDTGLIRSILSRFERDFKLDDLMLIGLMILLIQNDRKDCEKNSDEIILILGFLFLCGF